uniref:Uncharacterized protein n=1 Tax=Megaselia scalaris TaxID=36166 RepID=T1GGA6_MEGSC
MFVGPILQFLEKAQSIVSVEQSPQPQQKVNYALRQSPWASPQQISVIVQESQRLIKSKLSGLQRSMQLYLSNRDTEFIIFKPIRNNIIGAFSKLEQILTSNGYTNDDMIMTSCPSAEQVSILLSSASILATENARKISTSSIESVPAYTRKISQTEKKVSFDSPAITEEQLVVEEGDSKVLEESSSQDAILEVKEESSQVTNEADEPKVLKDEVDNNVGTPTV